MSLVSWLLTSPLFYSFNDFFEVRESGLEIYGENNKKNNRRIQKIIKGKA